MQKALDEQVKQVRLSNRLVASPACLVGAEMDYSPQMERLLQKGKGGGPKQRRILELNPNHELFIKLQERFQQNREDKAIGEYAQLLLVTHYWPKARKLRSRRDSTAGGQSDGQDAVTHRITDEVAYLLPRIRQIAIVVQVDFFFLDRSDDSLGIAAAGPTARLQPC